MVGVQGGFLRRPRLSFLYGFTPENWEGDSSFLCLRLNRILHLFAVGCGHSSSSFVTASGCSWSHEMVDGTSIIELRFSCHQAVHGLC